MTSFSPPAGGPSEGPGDERRRPAAVALAIWALLLGILAAVHAAFGGALLPVLVQGGAAAFMGLIALAIAVSAGRQSRRDRGVRMLPELSVATALAAVSGAALVDGASVGGWLIIGGGLGLMVATGGLIREIRAQASARRAADQSSATRAEAPAGGSQPKEGGWT